MDDKFPVSCNLVHLVGDVLAVALCGEEGWSGDAFHAGHIGVHGGGDRVCICGIGLADSAHKGVQGVSSVDWPRAGRDRVEFLLIQVAELPCDGSRDIGDQWFLCHESALGYIETSDLDEVIVDGGVSTDKRACQTGIACLADHQAAFLSL